MKPLFSWLLTTLVLASFATSLAHSQQLQTYQGSLGRGQASYSYTPSSDGRRILSGNWSYKESWREDGYGEVVGNGSITETGAFREGKKIGPWRYSYVLPHADILGYGNVMLKRTTTLDYQGSYMDGLMDGTWVLTRNVVSTVGSAPITSRKTCTFTLVNGVLSGPFKMTYSLSEPKGDVDGLVASMAAVGVDFTKAGIIDEVQAATVTGSCNALGELDGPMTYQLTMFNGSKVTITTYYLAGHLYGEEALTGAGKQGYQDAEFRQTIQQALAVDSTKGGLILPRVKARPYRLNDTGQGPPRYGDYCYSYTVQNESGNIIDRKAGNCDVLTNHIMVAIFEGLFDKLHGQAGNGQVTTDWPGTVLRFPPWCRFTKIPSAAERAEAQAKERAAQEEAAREARAKQEAQEAALALLEERRAFLAQAKPIFRQYQESLQAIDRFMQSSDSYQKLWLRDAYLDVLKPWEAGLVPKGIREPYSGYVDLGYEYLSTQKDLDRYMAQIEPVVHAQDQLLVLHERLLAAFEAKSDKEFRAAVKAAESPEALYKAIVGSDFTPYSATSTDKLSK